MRLQRESDNKKLEEIRSRLPFYISEYIQMRLDYLTPTTVLSYILDIEDFLEWVWHTLVPERNSIKDIQLIDLEKIIEIDISHYRSYLKYREDSHAIGNRFYKTKNQDSTISRKISALRNLFEFLTTTTNRETNTYYLSKNILENTKVLSMKVSVQAKAEKLKESILRKKELKDFQDFILVGYGETGITNMMKSYWEINKVRDAAIVSLLVGSGLRVGELVSLRIKDLNLDDRRLIVDRKRGKQDIVFFSKDARDFMNEYLIIRKDVYKADSKPNSPIFVTKYRGRVNPISKNAVQKMVMKYGQAFGKTDLTAHSLRHSFGTHLFNKTKNIRGVQKALGHTSIETTQIYTHIFDDDDVRLIDEAFETQ